MRLDLVVDVVDRPVLQSGNTSVLGRAYVVDEVILSLFQRAAEV
jgi:hypothetical protein